MFFPYFLSWVVASYFLQAFLDPTRGLLVNLLESWGVPPIDFYNDTTPWPFILTLCNVWKNTGYSAILYLAAITGIDASEYEAASIDGILGRAEENVFSCRAKNDPEHNLASAKALCNPVSSSTFLVLRYSIFFCNGHCSLFSHKGRQKGYRVIQN